MSQNGQKRKQDGGTVQGTGRDAAQQWIRDAYEGKEEMGTITLKTNRLDLNAFQVYSIYKQRQEIEQFFSPMGLILSFYLP